MYHNSVSQQALQDILQIFADFFIFPEKEFYEAVCSGAIDQQVKELGQILGYPLESSFKDGTPTYDQWVNAYNRCFLGTLQPFAPPIESIYKCWTTDESFQVSFKNQKGYLMGDSAQHVKHILEAFGLEIPSEYNLTPDHLTILLEIQAFLVANGFAQEARQFCRDHLDWLPDLQKALAKISAESDFYRYVLTELQRLLKVFDDLDYTELN